MKTSTHCKIIWAFKGYILVFRNVDDWECNKYYKTVKHIVVGDKVSQVWGPFIINNQKNSRGPRRACLKHALQPTARCPEQAFLCPVGRRVSWGNRISDYSPCGYLTAFPCDFLFVPFTGPPNILLSGWEKHASRQAFICLMLETARYWQ